jgi:hypothetical protein
MYHDIETDEVLTEDDLRNEYEWLYKNGHTETPTFKGYLRNCLSKNGTLERMDD